MPPAAPGLNGPIFRTDKGLSVAKHRCWREIAGSSSPIANEFTPSPLSLISLLISLLIHPDLPVRCRGDTGEEALATAKMPSPIICTPLPPKI